MCNFLAGVVHKNGVVRYNGLTNNHNEHFVIEGVFSDADSMSEHCVRIQRNMPYEPNKMVPLELQGFDPKDGDGDGDPSNGSRIHSPYAQMQDSGKCGYMEYMRNEEDHHTCLKRIMEH